MKIIQKLKNKIFTYLTVQILNILVPNFAGRVSKGDYTIVNILNVKGTPPPKLKERIEFYNKIEYKELFKTSKDNWNKIINLLE